MLPLALRQSMSTMLSGRPGPVNLDVPFNVFQEEADIALEAGARIVVNERRSAASTEDVATVVDMLLGAKKPVLFIGHGVAISEASEELTALAHRLSIPVISSPNGMGCIDMEDDLSLGFIGRNGAYAANQAGRLADVVLAVGARFDAHHGLLNAVFMPYVLVFNEPAIGERITRLSSYLGLEDPSPRSFLHWVLELRAAIGIPHTLAELGVLPGFRGLGIGHRLVRARLGRIDPTRFRAVVLRAPSSRSGDYPLYTPLGFEETGEVMDVSNLRVDGRVTSDRRVFLHCVISQILLDARPTAP
jgi:ribosomal protein S18 acetylase RimI-like enzyme